MSIAQSFSNFLELTREDEALFDLGEPEFLAHVISEVRVGPIVMHVFSDYSALILHKKHYFIADHQDEVGDVLMNLVQQHPYLRDEILTMKQAIAEAQS